ncbi:MULTISPECIES: hypothetical protein [Streptomyces diastaticus group]|uniref:Uncharacterized protein n=2 Tax=Streptomyces diastaticus group TaxID=2849069 RepID=A0A8H9LX50_9ACTN|nr:MULTISPECIES: hypothetical protein [Streptomyces diastaticus group]QNE85103.1 hypothetical protein F0345_28910 [Streptomyces rutgersensis]GFH81516.1 hypothetical protein Sgou_61860 [Streptomyces gougerotii]GGU92114.1 hypothetical protein GCM10010227_54310 [Streptomyces gougerotii]
MPRTPAPDSNLRPWWRRPWRWITAHRRLAASHFLRGLAYGAGTLVITLLGIWLQQ